MSLPRLPTIYMYIYDTNHNLSQLCPYLLRSGICEHLKKIQWRLFVTLTFPYESMRTPSNRGSFKRKGVTHSFLLDFTKTYRLWAKKHAFYIREELGEGKECHLHLLFEAKGLEEIDFPSLNRSITRLWANRFKVPVISKVEEVTSSTNEIWVNYITTFEVGKKGEIYEYIDYQSEGLRKRLRRLSQS